MCDLRPKTRLPASNVTDPLLYIAAVTILSEIAKLQKQYFLINMHRTSIESNRSFIHMPFNTEAWREALYIFQFFILSPHCVRVSRLSLVSLFTVSWVMCCTPIFPQQIYHRICTNLRIEFGNGWRGLLPPFPPPCGDANVYRDPPMQKIHAKVSNLTTEFHNVL